jgi:hypothetical protein
MYIAETYAYFIYTENAKRDIIVANVLKNAPGPDRVGLVSVSPRSVH